MIPLFAFWFGGAGAAPDGPPPSGAPSNLTSETYSQPPLVRLRWTNGDLAAYTRVYTRTSPPCTGAATQIGVVNPGIFTFDTGVPPSQGTVGYAVRHYKNGQLSAESNCVIA